MTSVVLLVCLVLCSRDIYALVPADHKDVFGWILGLATGYAMGTCLAFFRVAREDG